jgi:hypothetical protein
LANSLLFKNLSIYIFAYLRYMKTWWKMVFLCKSYTSIWYKHMLNKEMEYEISCTTVNKTVTQLTIYIYIKELSIVFTFCSFLWCTLSVFLWDLHSVKYMLSVKYLYCFDLYYQICKTEDLSGQMKNNIKSNTCKLDLTMDMLIRYNDSCNIYHSNKH